MADERSDSRQEPLSTDKAFALIFRPDTRVSVEHWLARLGVPRQDRSDLVQDVLLAAFASFPTYDPTRARPERWLNRIAVHIASRHLQRARHRREELLPDGFDAELDIPSVEEQLACEQDRQLVLAVLQSLDGDERTVVMEHDLEGLPIADIAQRRGLPVSTAYKWRARGIEAFREAVTRVRRLESGPQIERGPQSGEDELTALDDGSIERASDRC